MTDYSKLATVHPSLSRGQVWCTHCGRTQHVDGADCLRNGWPKCCGYTMTIDSPEERAALIAKEGKDAKS
jgi:hypothetical protein